MEDRLMSKALYDVQYFFEATCEYTYDTHKEDYKDILNKMFPDNKADIDVKIQDLENGHRVIYQNPFTVKDVEMEKFIANAIKE